jgi:peptidoglycan/xylan/chitin deacetylase (PgdA/CDA1 family)
MKALSGRISYYFASTIVRYLLHDGPLPSKPIMITFDDTRGEQYTLALKWKNTVLKACFLL